MFNDVFRAINSIKIQTNFTEILVIFVANENRTTFQRYLPFELKVVNEKLEYTAYHFIGACSASRMVQLDRMYACQSRIQMGAIAHISLYRCTTCPKTNSSMSICYLEFLLFNISTIVSIFWGERF